MQYKIIVEPDITNNRMVIQVGTETANETFYIGNISEDEIPSEVSDELLAEFVAVVDANGDSIFEALLDALLTRLRYIIAMKEYSEEIEGLTEDEPDEE